MVFPVFLYYRYKVFRCFISPAALSKPKSKLRCNITSSDHLTELFRNIIRRISGNYIQIKVRSFTKNMKSVRPCITDVKGKCRRIVNI